MSVNSSRSAAVHTSGVPARSHAEASSASNSRSTFRASPLRAMQTIMHPNETSAKPASSNFYSRGRAGMWWRGGVPGVVAAMDWMVGRIAVIAISGAHPRNRISAKTVVGEHD